MRKTSIEEQSFTISSKSLPENRDQITADLAQIEDLETILELNKLEYGTTDVLVTPTDFYWRYNQNPAGLALIPAIRNSRKQVVGFIWVLPLKLRMKGQNYVAASGTNLLIHPQYRNSFAYIKLLRQFDQVFRKNKFPLHFSFISEENYQRLRQHSPQMAWTVPLLFKPLNVSKLAQTYGGQSWPSYFTKSADQLVSFFYSRHRIKDGQENITIQAIDQFDTTFDKFWGDLQDKYPLMLIRDRAFLAWRFTNTSRRQYQILVAQTEFKMLGYIVLRCTTIWGVDTGLVLDFLVLDDELGEKAGAYLLTHAETYFREQQMAVTLGLMAPFAAEYRIFRRADIAACHQNYHPDHFVLPSLFMIKSSRI